MSTFVLSNVRRSLYYPTIYWCRKFPYLTSPTYYGVRTSPRRSSGQFGSIRFAFVDRVDRGQSRHNTRARISFKIIIRTLHVKRLLKTLESQFILKMFELLSSTANASFLSTVYSFRIHFHIPDFYTPGHLRSTDRRFKGDYCQWRRSPRISTFASPVIIFRNSTRVHNYSRKLAFETTVDDIRVILKNV